jgi:hypothetical protein
MERRIVMHVIWQKGRYVLVGVLFVFSLTLALVLPTAPAKGASAGPVPFEGRYYNTMTLSGTPVLVRRDQDIRFFWGTGSPDRRVHADQFSVRWVRTAFFQEGLYQFTVSADDGVRLFLDGQKVIDQWRDQSVRSYTAILPLSGSVAHTITMEYYEHQGTATATLNWKQITTAGSFIGAYYNNTALSGVPTQMRVDPTINFTWGSGSPYPSTLGNDQFSVRWTMSTSLSAGQYRFTVTADDGVRLYLDGKMIIDQWKDQPATTYSSIKMISAGTHTLKMEYYEQGGVAIARLAWQPIRAGNGYVGVYYDNRTLSGVPTQMRIDPAVNFAWKDGSPDPTIPSDQFSVRWIRNVHLDEGMYHFTVTVDDGVRLFVDGAPIIDHWKDQPATTYTRNVWLTQGTHSINMEYYEHSGAATAKLSFQRISS